MGWTTEERSSILGGAKRFFVSQGFQTSSKANLPSHLVRKVDTFMEGKHTQLGSDHSPRRSAEVTNA
jgi:hypothetical protein